MGSYQLTWPASRRFESVRGWVLRFAAVNGFPSIKALAPLLSERIGVELSSSTDIATSPGALRVLADMAGHDGSEQVGRAWVPHPSAEEDHVQFEGVIVPADALLLDRLQICPYCLTEAEYIRVDWDLSHVVACDRHGCILIDRCHACGRKIPIDMPLAESCHDCGTSYADLRTHPASAEMLAASEDAAGLAPLMFLYGTSRYQAHSASLFALCRLVAHPDVGFWTDKVRRIRFSTLAAQERALTIERLGRCRVAAGYSVECLRALFFQRFEHLAAFDAFGARELRLRQLMRASQLPLDLRNFILFGTEQGETGTAVALEGRTTGYTEPSQVASLLGIPQEGVAWLRRHGKLSAPADRLGFSTYEILDCHRMLLSLVPFETFDKALAVTGLARELETQGLLEVWNVQQSQFTGITLSSLNGLLDAIRIATDRSDSATGSPADKAPIHAPQPGGWPAHECGRLVAALLQGSVKAIGWQAPWRLQDIGLSDATVRRFAP